MHDGACNIGLFSRCGGFESENGRINVDYLYSRQIAWILNSWQIVIDRRPRLNERIKIATAPYDFTNYVGFRNFLSMAKMAR